MPPRGNRVANGNYIGLGVGYDDPGDSTLVYLGNVRREMRAILDLSRQIQITGVRGPSSAASRIRDVQRENTDQLRLFQTGQREQMRLFSQAETEKTRIVQTESHKRVRANNEAAREIARIKRDAEKSFRPATGPISQRVAAEQPELYARYVETIRRHEGLNAANARTTPLQPSSMSARMAQEQPELYHRYMQAIGRKRQLEEETEKAEAQQKKWVEGHVRSQQRRATIEDFEFQQRGTRSIGSLSEEERTKALTEARERRRQRDLRRQAELELDRERPIYGPQRDIDFERRRTADERRARSTTIPTASEAEASERVRLAKERARKDARDRILAEENAARQEEQERAFRESQRRRQEDEQNRRVAAEAQRLEAQSKRVPQTDEEYERLRRERISRRAGAGQSPQQREARRLIEENRFEGQFGPARNELEKTRDSLLKFRKEADQISLRRARTQVGADASAISREIGLLQQRASLLHREIAQGPGRTRPYETVRRDLDAVTQAAQRARNRLRDLNEAAQNAGQQQDGRPGGPFGTLSTVARITRNIVLYEVISRATYGLLEYAGASIKAARAEDDRARAMTYASQQARVTIERNSALVEQLRTTIGISRRQGQEAVTEAARFSSDRPQLIRPLTEAVADIGAARGVLGEEEVAGLIEQFRRRESKFFKRSLGKTVEELYEAEAARTVDSRVDARSLQIGKRDREEYRSRRQQIAEVVAGMSEEQKEAIALNAILEKGNEVKGAAAQRTKELAGQLQTAANRWDDFTSSIGRFISQSRPIGKLLGEVTGVLNAITTRPVGTGSGGLITERDQLAQVQRNDKLSSLLFNAYPQFYPIMRLMGLQNRPEAQESARVEAEQQRKRLAGEGQLYYLSNRPGELTRRFTPEQRDQLLKDKRYTPAEFDERVEDAVDDQSAQITGSLDKLQKGLQDTSDAFWKDLYKREEAQRQESINRTTAALAKLREFTAGSFRLTEEIAFAETGSQNNFVKPLSDMETAAQRMRLQWGFLGDDAVKFFTTLEKRRITLELTRQQFDALARSQENSARASQLIRDRESGLGIGQLEQAQINVAQAASRAAQQNPALAAQERFLRTGIRPQMRGPQSLVNQQLDRLGDLRLDFDGKALGREARDAVEEILDSVSEGITGAIDPNTLRRSPFLNRARIEAIDTASRRQERNDRAIENAVKRAQITAGANEEVSRQVQQATALRNRLLEEGRPDDFVMREYDKRILAITGAIDPKDLSTDSYQARIDAFKREAERASSEESEARKAIENTQKIQAGMADDVKAIRAALLGGDARVLIQVENDTAARIDTEALKDVEGSGFRYPGGGANRINPYSDAFARYERGGRR